MIQKNLLKLAIVGLTAGLFLSAQSAQTNKEIPQPKKEVVAETNAQLPQADVSADQKEVAMMKGMNEPVGEMQKFDTQESCNKPACKSCNECTPSKPCKSCNKCEPKGCTKEPAPVKKCNSCNKCEQKPCGCKKCEETPKPCTSKGAAKTAVEG
jgi:hypothetical protein